MRRLVCVVLLMAAASFCWSQGRQVKMYLEQIAANKVYLEYLQKGYQVVKKGLGVINGIKDGHFNLDQLFFNGLSAINPKVRQYPRVADITILCVRTIRSAKRSLKLMKKEKLFTAKQVQYAEQVFTTMTAGCLLLLDDLSDLLKPGFMQLSDDERISRIDAVYQEMQDQYVFVNNWSSETAVMLFQMKKEQHDVRVMQGVNGLK